MEVLGQTEVLVEGLTLPECPRWHDGALYFVDIAAGQIYRLGRDDKPDLLYQAKDDFVGGLGFAEDGALLAVLSKGRQIVRIVDGEETVHADLRGLCRFVLNDMVVTRGRAYVSQPGFDIWAAHPDGMPPVTELLLAGADGTCAIAATDMMSPNGMAVSPDGGTLYVAESTDLCISCFDIDPVTGALTNRRVFGRLPDGGFPDGICVDADGAVWAAVPVAVSGMSYGGGPGVVRMIEGGEVTHLVPAGAGRRALACAFGGDARDVLYVCTVPDFDGASAESAGQGRLERVVLPFTGAGIP